MVCGEHRQRMDMALVRRNSTVTADRSASPQPVTFHESGLEAAQVVTLMEAGATFNEERREIIVRPIKSGFGNARDGFYYTKDALREAVRSKVFDGRKMFANHPSREDDRARPERSVWDWVSTLKEAWWDDATDEPRARIKVYDDRFWERAKAAPDEIAFSILGGGMARPGVAEGRQARIVEALTQIKSLDWVTEAGAGGGIVAFAESAHEEFEMDLGTLTLEQLREARPDLIDEAVAEADGSDEETAAATDTDEEESDEDESDEAEETENTEADADADESDEDEADADAGADADETEAEAETPAAEPAETKEAATPNPLEARIAALEEQLRESQQATLRESALAAGSSVVEATLRESTLPGFAKEQLKTRFAEASVGEGFTWPDDETLRAAIRNEIKFVDGIVSKYAGRKPAVSIGSDDSENVSTREAVSRSLENLWGEDLVPSTKTANDDEAVAAGTGAVTADSEQPAAMSEAGVAVARDIEAKFSEYDL